MEKSIQEKTANEIAKYTYDFNLSMECILPAVGNTAMYTKVLNNIPHKEMFDMTLYFRIVPRLKDSSSVVSSFVVTNEMMETWKRISQLPIDAQTLYQNAIGNAKQINRLAPLRQMIAEQMSDAEGIEVKPVSMADDGSYVSTNTLSNYGAAAAFLGIGIVELADQLSKDLYILPSSVHEVILIPNDGRIFPHEFAAMVSQVNQNMVNPADRLSDSVYCYSRSKRAYYCAFNAEEYKISSRTVGEAEQKDISESAMRRQNKNTAPRRGR